MFTIYSFIEVGMVVAFLGACGILVNTKNIIISIICIELMFYGFNFYVISISVFLDDILGEIISFFIVTLAASESALALALVTAYFKIAQGLLVLYWHEDEDWK